MPSFCPLFRRCVLVPLFWTLACTSSYSQPTPQQDIPNNQALTIPMTPPEEALAMIELPAGFNVTLAASEPEVHQPIAAAFDYRGPAASNQRQ